MGLQFLKQFFQTRCQSNIMLRNPMLFTLLRYLFFSVLRNESDNGHKMIFITG